MMVSYAQDAEDVLLQRVFPRDYRGFYIDAGASDPVQFSVTKHLYDHGWRGVNIEPVPSVWGRLRDQRHRDVNLNAGLSDRVGRLTFYEVPSETTWSTFSAVVAEGLVGRGLDVRPREIPVTTLARVCDEHADAPIDVLKIDVEGLELEVITGGDWVRWRPRVVLVENNGAELWEPILLGHGYLHAVTTEINRYYVRDEDRSLLPRFLAPLGRQDSFILAGELHALGIMRGPAGEAHGEARAAQSHGQAVGPNMLRLQRMAARHPRLAAVGKALLRLAD
jgi:FkbM family methyltransferase